VSGPSLGIVVATRDRREQLLETLGRLTGQAPVVVVDNGSADGTAAAVREAFAEVTVIELGENLGAAARTPGVRALGTNLVAFADDDSWWAPGALERARALFAERPSLGLVAARVLVGPDERLDPVAEAMGSSPLPAPPGLPGRAVLGFVACGAVVRSSAYLAVGGFERRLGVGGEEELLALDLAAAGYEVVYVPELVAHHHPAPGSRPGRTVTQRRNALWTDWLRRPARVALGRTLRTAAEGVRRPEARDALRQAAPALPWALRRRRVLPPGTEAALRRVESARSG